RLIKLLVHHLPARAVTSGLVASFPLKLAGVFPRICQHVFCCLGGANLLGSRPKLLKDFSRFFKRRGDRLPVLRPRPSSVVRMFVRPQPPFAGFGPAIRFFGARIPPLLAVACHYMTGRLLSRLPVYFGLAGLLVVF